jgi:hypothetical protein
MLFLVEPKLSFPLRAAAPTDPAAMPAEEAGAANIPSQRDYTIYVPKIFGFRIHETGIGGARARWLRLKADPALQGTPAFLPAPAP